MSSRLFVHQYYEALLLDRSVDSANSHHPENFLETLLRVRLSRLPEAPPFMIKNPLTPNLAVPEPMLLHFFRESVEDLPIVEQANSSKSFEKDLHWEIFTILAGTLAAEHYRKECVMLLSESTLSCLRCATFEGVPDVGWIDAL